MQRIDLARHRGLREGGAALVVRGARVVLDGDLAPLHQAEALVGSLLLMHHRGLVDVDRVYLRWHHICRGSGLETHMHQWLLLLVLLGERCLRYAEVGAIEWVSDGVLLPALAIVRLRTAK